MFTGPLVLWLDKVFLFVGQAVQCAHSNTVENILFMSESLKKSHESPNFGDKTVTFFSRWVNLNLFIMLLKKNNKELALKHIAYSIDTAKVRYSLSPRDAGNSRERIKIHVKSTQNSCEIRASFSQLPCIGKIRAGNFHT